MGKQLVVSGNRILSYGEDCFYSMGGTVICPTTEKVFQNATVVNCDYFPSDIDTVGYEYHAGEFVPCAPFGKGDDSGNIALFCNTDCKTLKDSGVSLKSLIDRFIDVKLLWQNASPESTFYEQTINTGVTVGVYDFLICETSSGTFFLPKKDCSNTFFSEGNATGSNYLSLYMRSFITKNTYSINGYYLGIIVSDCKYLEFQDGVTVETPYSDKIIPLKIYGVKL